MINTVMRRSVSSGIRTWELFLSKYREVTQKDKEIIRRHVLSNSEGGIYEVGGNMTVMWWEV